MKVSGPPPQALKASGRELWRDLMASFEWEGHELHVVKMACVHYDVWSTSVKGRSTRDRATARAESIVVSRLLRELKVNQEAASRPPDLARGRA